MPQWLVITIVVVFALVVLGFFALMFNEMAVKRKTGRMRPGVEPTRDSRGGPGGTPKPKTRKSR